MNFFCENLFGIWLNRRFSMAFQSWALILGRPRTGSLERARLMTSSQERLNQVGLSHLLGFAFLFCAKETPFLVKRHSSRWTHSLRNSAVKQNGAFLAVFSKLRLRQCTRNRGCNKIHCFRRNTSDYKGKIWQEAICRVNIYSNVLDYITWEAQKWRPAT